MAVDCAGNVYATQVDAIQVLDPTGALLGKIEVKTDNPNIVSNIAFGGAENSTLFATVESYGVPKEDREYSIRSIGLSIPGLPYQRPSCSQPRLGEVCPTGSEVLARVDDSASTSPFWAAGDRYEPTLHKRDTFN